MVAPPHNYLYGYLKSLGQAPQSGLKEISRLFHPCLIPKGSHFLAQGEVQKSAGFVIKGLFRYYYVDPKGQEHTKHFVRENDFVISLSAFLTGKPSLFFIQALEDATILKAPASNLKSLVRENTYWKDIFLILLEQSYLTKEKRTADFLMKNAQERYRSFVLEFPDLLKRIKRYHLASYLGIQPESLSRIKKSQKV